MAKYIDADAFQTFLEDKIEETKSDKENSYGDEYYEMAVEATECAFKKILSELKNEPIVNAQEVKHAKWEHYGEYAQCSNCEHVTEDYCIDGDAESGYYTVLPHYCSNCGARMDMED